METQPQDTRPEPTAFCACGRRRSWGWRVVHALVLLLLLAIVYLAGMASGAALGRMRTQRINGVSGSRVGMMAAPFGASDRLAVGMPIGGWMEKRPTNLDGRMETTSSTTPFFGSVARIEGNRIVILNNGAQEQVVLSQAQTVILFADREVGLSSVTVGQMVRGVGVTNADATVTAKAIWLLL